jgi:septal ring factor EnvC (AmiA/AmiB activator)
VTALLLGWAALRIVWTEVLQSRREHAADRAATAGAYRSLFTERAAEHAEFTTVMTERLAESNSSIYELQAALVKTQRTSVALAARAETAESRFASALVRVAELERSIDMLRAEREAAAGSEFSLVVEDRGTLDDLIAFDDKLAQAAGKHAAAESKLA